MEIPVFENKTLVGTLQVASQGLYTVFELRLPSPPCLKGGAPVRTLGRGDTEEKAEQKTRAGEERMNPPDLASLGHPPLGKGGKALPDRAEIPMTRLWLLGGTGGAASLGLLEPRDGERRLCRRMSRLELRQLPEEPWTALALPAGERPAAGKPNTPAGASSSPWLLCPDGSLYDPRQRLLALPWAGGEPPAPARKIFVGGRDYLVFRY